MTDGSALNKGSEIFNAQKDACLTFLGEAEQLAEKFYAVFPFEKKGEYQLLRPQLLEELRNNIKECAEIRIVSITTVCRDITKMCLYVAKLTSLQEDNLKDLKNRITNINQKIKENKQHIISITDKCDQNTEILRKALCLCLQPVLGNFRGELKSIVNTTPLPDIGTLFTTEEENRKSKERLTTAVEDALKYHLIHWWEQEGVAIAKKHHTDLQKAISGEVAQFKEDLRLLRISLCLPQHIERASDIDIALEDSLVDSSLFFTITSHVLDTYYNMPNQWAFGPCVEEKFKAEFHEQLFCQLQEKEMRDKIVADISDSLLVKYTKSVNAYRQELQQQLDETEQLVQESIRQFRQHEACICSSTQTLESFRQRFEILHGNAAKLLASL